MQPISITVYLTFCSNTDITKFFKKLVQDPMAFPKAYQNRN